MKNNKVLFIIGCALMLLASCLGSGDSYTTDDIQDAQIASLVLSHDSVEGLGNVKFTIDQINGLIFNNDSLPYGTEIGKVVCTLTYSVGVGSVRVVQEALGDTLWWNGTDSLDFSRAVGFTTLAYDGKTEKTYQAWVNIHREQPDSMVWESLSLPASDARERSVVKFSYNDNDAYLMYVKTSASCLLYYSGDAEHWAELPLTGLPGVADISQITPYENTLYVPVAPAGLYRSSDGQNWTIQEDAPAVGTILGLVREGRDTPPLLAAILRNEEADVFAAMNREGQWTEGNTVPENFPVSAFGHISYNRMNHEYLSVVAGKNRRDRALNTTWATTNATSWALLSGEDENFFEPKSGIMLTLYDDMFYLLGGINAADQASKEIHLSIDNGATWFVADTLKNFPENYPPRGYASVHVDAANHLLLFGGKTSEQGKSLNELWRGRINRLK
ncbi:MAG: DUF6242 domain-containing protein [Tannerellaceae bacterium]|jgi:hypothetical protein|nr:DUF6242 domain-containing protein [Tannerellaceae bacterium]